MNHSRRTFLKFLLATPAAAFVDYEQLLWVPTPMVTVGEVPTIIIPGFMDDFFKADPLLAYLKSRSRETWGPGPIIQENPIYRPQ